MLWQETWKNIYVAPKGKLRFKRISNGINKWDVFTAKYTYLHNVLLLCFSTWLPNTFNVWCRKPSTDLSRSTICSVPKENTSFFTVFYSSFIFVNFSIMPPFHCHFMKWTWKKKNLVEQTGLSKEFKTHCICATMLRIQKLWPSPTASQVTWTNGNSLMEPTRSVCSL